MAENIQEVERLAFEEEQLNLERTEKRLDAYIEDKTRKIKRLKAELEEYRGDSERYLDFLETQRKIAIAEEEKAETNEIVSSPYFARLDVNSGENEDDVTYFIGKKGFSDYEGILVLDWKTPMGSMFYNKKAKSFQVEGFLYDLILRRAIDIRNASLCSVQTEFDAINMSIEGDIIDRFLLTVLQDKRRSRRLTDIIRSIQQNQNEIIRLPYEKSYVVQGCAGSGKTMILSHRLSYLSFNMPEISPSKYIVLTPNRLFDEHVDELRRELDLTNIRRFTVEEFYAHLANVLGREDRIEGNRGNSEQKVHISADNLKSEKNLNSALLKKLYSIDFYEECCTDINKNMQSAKDKLQDIPLQNIFERNGIRNVDLSTLNKGEISKAQKAIEKILSDYDKQEQEYTISRKKLSGIEEIFKQKNDLFEEKDAALLEIETTLYSAASEYVNSKSEINRKNREVLKEKEKEIKKLQKEKTQLFQTIRDRENGIEFLKMNANKLLSYEFVQATDNEITHHLAKVYKAQYEQLKECDEKLADLAIYNFGKRRQINQEKKAVEESLTVEIAKYTAQQQLETEEANRRTRREISEVDQQISDTNASLIPLQEADRMQDTLYDAYKHAISIIDADVRPNLNLHLSNSEKEKIGMYYQEYSKRYQEYAEAKYAMSQSRTEKEKLEKNIQTFGDWQKKEGDISQLTGIFEILQSIDIRNFLKSLEEKLKALYEKFGEIYREADNYRHKVFLKLLLCYVYYGAPPSTNYLVSVDEAQDVSISEYKLIKAILGKKATFNLYGDVNQLVYDYKGVEDWSDIEAILGSEVFVLNENYRNTIEITEYCNDAFCANVTSIGLHGDNVEELPMEKAIQELVEALGKENSLRTAIIYKTSQSKVKEAIKTAIDNCGAEELITVRTVEEAKGLEFDQVIVIKNGMSFNELYISYTRALEKLMICEL